METPKKLDLEPPDPQKLVGWDRMGTRERAHAFRLAEKNKIPFDRTRVGYEPETDVVVVTDPEYANITAFSMVRGDLQDILADLERRGLRVRWEELSRGE